MPVRVTPGTETSPVFRVKGQKSRWNYPDQRLSPENCTELVNIDISENGIANTRGGHTKFNTLVLPNSEAAVGITQQTWSTGTKIVVCTTDHVYLDDGTTRKDVTGSLTLTGTYNNRYRFAFLRDQLIATNGVDATWVKDNDNDSSPSNAAALTGMPWTTCEDLVTHKGLLIALAPTEGGTKYSTRLRWCDVNTSVYTPDITIWPDINRYEVYEGGTAIVGAVDNFGKCLVFKRDGLYPGAIEYDTGYMEFRPQDPIRGFSPIAKCSLIARPEFVFGVADEGAFIVTGDLSFKIVTLDIQDKWNDLNRPLLQYAQAYLREDEHQVRCLLASKYISGGFDRELVFDWETGDVWIDELTETGSTTMVMNYTTRLLRNDTEAVLRGALNGWTYWGNSGVEDDGSSIPWVIEFSPNDLGYPGKTKNIQFFRTVFLDQDYQGTVTISVSRDQGLLQDRTKNINLSSTLVWDNDETAWDDGTLWDEGEKQTNLWFFNRYAETIAPRFSSNSPISLVGYQVEFTVEE